MSRSPAGSTPGARPQLDFRRLRNLPIERILAARGIHLARRGTRRVGPCPVHGGDNPGAFVVHTGRNVWFCFTRCGGGDVIDLIARIDGISLAAAARHLATIATDLPPATVSHQPTRLFRPFTRRLRLDPHAPWLRRKGIDPATASRFEVGAWHGPGFLQGCVAVRLHDPAGQPPGYAGRRCDPHEAARHGKWKLPAGLPKRHLLYNLHRLGPLHGQTIVVVEGPWDVLALAQIGVPAVALLGVQMSAEQARLLEQAGEVIVMLDGDPAGRAAGREIVARLKGAQRVDLLDERDPGDLEERELLVLLSPFFFL